VTLTLSPQVRLIALLGALVAVLLAATMFFLMRSGGEQAAGVSEAELAQALTPLATPKTAAPATKRAAAKPAAKTPAAKPKAAAKRAVKAPPAVTKEGVPWAIAQALRKDPVVVVSLFASGAEVDGFTLEEARAGAQSAGAGFVSLDVLAKRNAEPLATFLGAVVEPPVVLVYQRPAALFLKFDGFVDRDTVAQAAQDAGAVTVARG
jgi:hypothetical protein